MTEKLILARHAQTDWNVKKRIQGQKGASLNSDGVLQARALGRKLREKHRVDLIFSSTLDRSCETAIIAAEELGIDSDLIKYDKRLIECGFGELEGLTAHEVYEQYGEKWKPHIENYAFEYDFREVGGERREDVIGRHLEALGEMESLDTETVLVIGHGRGLNNYLAHKWPNVPAIINNCDFRLLDLTRSE